MWDPLLNDFPESVHGFRCMLAVKYLQAVRESYDPSTLGYDLLSDLIGVVRRTNYVEATSRYHHFHSRLESASSSELRQPRVILCTCPHCPRHKQTSGLFQQTQLQKTEDLSNLSEPRCPKGV
uniref:Protein V2 n=1 Tax=Cotton leaf curl Gezira virus TaxID=222459 RepID=A0A127Z2A9_9GEMI|nr:pre coat protein [Cotton leaf curl Gezira virus]CDO50020.1 pre coat protein [Cotton leaf curl Gezira virus]CDO50026.1 pre coat protein [Cotton leaf curl Gezira virus]CDO50032.1 pre coat protein [Cotton leaf curl Gezira virus]